MGKGRGGDVPESKVLFDHFYIVKLMNKALDDIQRSLYQHERSAMRRRVFLDTRYMPLKNAEDVSRFRAKLDNALTMTEPLLNAYYLKEARRRI